LPTKRCCERHEFIVADKLQARKQGPCAVLLRGVRSGNLWGSVERGCLGGEVLRVWRMVAFVAQAALTKSEQSCSLVSGGGLAAELPPLTVPKTEKQVHREPEEGGEYDLYLHGRKRAKVQESVPCPESQVSMKDVGFLEHLIA